MTEKHNFWTLKNEADASEAELLIYGEISSDADLWHAFVPDDPMLSAKEFWNSLKALDGKNLTLRINSPGGDVFQAQAMYNQLKAYSGKIRCHIDGICASAATLVACAADEIVMPANALFMIHNPLLCFSNQAVTKAEMEKCLEQLDKTKETLVNVYTARCGDSLTRDEVEAMMEEETWMTAQEALENGFVDVVDDYGVSAVVNAGVLMVNNVPMKNLDPNKVKALKHLCKQSKERTMNNNDSIMDRLKAFLDGQDKRAAEAERVNRLEALKGDNPVVNALVDAGKAHGATAETLKPYLDAAAAVKPENKTLDELKALITDQMQSGASGVKASVTEPVPGGASHTKQAEIDDIVNLVNKKRG